MPCKSVKKNNVENSTINLRLGEMRKLLVGEEALKPLMADHGFVEMKA